MKLKPIVGDGFVLRPALAADFDELHALRLRAMRDSGGQHASMPRCITMRHSLLKSGPPSTPVEQHVDGRLARHRRLPDGVAP